ncbi:hypothetical protein NHX12_001795 [Muraenolepis orangiensis]|uniref:Uncharacterized protein n=1 Tax=Muraenolepis orangiensis TaxID=630683 RepID=A0A9Q0IGV1_9TELE|nr:hypothetical protein NHX12_001795 [Muraenolepis orangiensis]
MVSPEKQDRIRLSRLKTELSESVQRYADLQKKIADRTRALLPPAQKENKAPEEGASIQAFLSEISEDDVEMLRQREEALLHIELPVASRYPRGATGVLDSQVWPRLYPRGATGVLDSQVWPRLYPRGATGVLDSQVWPRLYPRGATGVLDSQVWPRLYPRGATGVLGSQVWPRLYPCGATGVLDSQVWPRLYPRGATGVLDSQSITGRCCFNTRGRGDTEGRRGSRQREVERTIQDVLPLWWASVVVVAWLPTSLVLTRTHWGPQNPSEAPEPIGVPRTHQRPQNPLGPPEPIRGPRTHQRPQNPSQAPELIGGPSEPIRDPRTHQRPQNPSGAPRTHQRPQNPSGVPRTHGRPIKTGAPLCPLKACLLGGVGPLRLQGFGNI